MEDESSAKTNTNNIRSFIKPSTTTTTTTTTITETEVVIDSLEEQRKQLEKDLEEVTKRLELEKTKREEQEKLRREEAARNEALELMRDVIWDKYVGNTMIRHKCFCCKTCTVHKDRYKFGFIDPSHKSVNLANIRPICPFCYDALHDTVHMIDFIKQKEYYL